MNTLDSKQIGLNTDLYWKPEAVKIADGTEQSLKQEDFFALLTEQLANQDPTKPVNNDQLVAQMTSFTMADGISQLNTKFGDFAASMTSSQALQASSLIGQNVLVTGNIGHMSEPGQGVTGVIINEETSQDTKIAIQNSQGEVVRTMNIGTLAAGNVQFNWDGTDQDGNPLPAGDYAIQVQGDVLGEPTSLPTAINRHVDSVSLTGAGQGVILNLDGDVSIKLDDVIQIGN
ncbi:flagellar hook assembly protein FlgD [Brumicola pallidula]|uniref:Basal-body rod modification protein FlgD n=1 Tax=Brumicola pallidula DSM 14239 = ACAM 615 TaxID=1121922 RepID=K6Z9Y5_9ALTE|nr:flagellar hook assembly protein FlgD [Glaciecola pallidula]GAC27187.1 flagellar basal-body rod modification protein FlgD [Glaciecola pallidula DSM 14239 = ACAM 615]